MGVARPQAKKQGACEEKAITSYRHTDKRVNNPPVGMVTPETDRAEKPTRWAYDPHIAPELQFDVRRSDIERIIDDALAAGDEKAMRDALETLKRMSDPYLNWAGKAERTSFEVETVSLHVHERMDPATVLANLQKRMKEKKRGKDWRQPDLFSPPFEDLPLRKAIEFYKHEKGWANRLIAGDSLLVMNSLLQKEGMAGQVQMIYIDPPYGIKYGSNFQPFVNKRDVKDGKDEDLTQEPEVIKAFRDTWELGIHSYLTYLRDRLLLARELLAETGSIFVQIGDEHLHLVRNLMDEVFGTKNFVGIIGFSKTTGFSGRTLSSIADYLVWYARDIEKIKYRQLFRKKQPGDEGATKYRPISSIRAVPDGRFDSSRLATSDQLTSQGTSAESDQDLEFAGRVWRPPQGLHWKTTIDGLRKLTFAGRVIVEGNSIRYIRFFDDFPVFPLSNIWVDVGGIQSRTEGKIYVVQTATLAIERCLLMTTDPGDLVLDPTCGSGTTAYVAEKWGRRWITCDTSRVAITLAKQRLLTASFDYYKLKYPQEGLKGGFIYKTVPHITLKSIANNPEIDEIYEKMHPAIEEALEELNRALRAEPPPPFKVTEGGRKGQLVDFTQPASATVKLPSGEKAPAGKLLEWEVPFDFPADWPEAARIPFEAFHHARIAMQEAMDASIAAHADHEVLVDQPEVDKCRLRISGPFTVEAVPFPTVLALEEAERPREADTAVSRSGETARIHQWMDELLKTGIRGKGGQVLRFAELELLPDTRYLHAIGTLADSGETVAVSFGPEFAPLEQRQVQMALDDAQLIRPRPKYIVFAAFEFDPEAAKDIDEICWPGVTLLKAQMNTDLLTEDLKKKRASNQSFWLMGQPDVELRRRKDGKYEVEVHGFDYFDTCTGELVSGGKGKIAMWLLDTDYDNRSLYPRQVFFPMAGQKDGWHKLKKDLRAELNERLLERFHGTVSLPFEPGDYRRIAVKIIDDRGIESLRVIPLPEAP
ncbi:MAG: site-specific DNA-methyltransferase [Gammaproteobacteria bacterium]|nr:MAG: site-specific DNA-methyltransferase [Gammaproteobacteria bacterium]